MNIFIAICIKLFFVEIKCFHFICKVLITFKILTFQSILECVTKNKKLLVNFIKKTWQSSSHSLKNIIINSFIKF